VNVANANGVAAAQSGLTLSSGLSFNTIADPNGNFQLFVPLQASPFTYASATLQIIDPLTQNSLGTQVIDLSKLTMANPINLPTANGSPCIDDDADDPDDDDPDCDQ
jgi:hypothetical protein